jgi:hypothetical protein
MALSDFEIFNKQVYRVSTELQDQEVNKFNEASRGAIILQSAANQGDYSEEAHYAKVANLIRRRDAYGSGAVSETTLTHLLNTSVKVGSGTPPVRIDPGMYKWIQKSPEEAAVVIGKQLAEDSLADMLNTSLLALRNAMAQVAAVVHDGTAGTNSLAALNTGASLFGDRAQALQIWVMHSKVVFDIYGAAIANANQLFEFGNIKVMSDGMGRPFIVTDSPSLVTSGSPDTYHTLGLQGGSVVVQQNNDYTANVETKNGDENIIRSWQAEWSYNLGMRGFTWDKANGGASPTDAALGTATNWDKTVTSNKDLPGVVVNTQ